MPPGFLAIDLLKSMLPHDAGLNLFDPNEDDERLNWWAGGHPSLGDAVIAVTRTIPHVSIEARGGYDLIYLPRRLTKAELTRRAHFIVEQLFAHDYVSGVFVNEKRLGRVEGALSLKHLGAGSEADEELPDIVVNFTSSTLHCGHPTICAIAVADTPVQEGHDMVAGFSRAEMAGFMAARGPDFQERFNSRTPASAADMARTLAALMGLTADASRRHAERVLTESLRGSEAKREPEVRTRVIRSRTSSSTGWVTEVHLQSVNGVDYLHAAGAPGRSVGVPEAPQSVGWNWEWPKWKTFTISITPD